MTDIFGNPLAVPTAVEELAMEADQEARELRDAVYGLPISDKSWEAIGKNWVADVEWLRARGIVGASGASERQSVERRAK